MTKLTVKNWINQELVKYARKAPSNCLSAALQLATLHLLTSGLARNIDEESFTGALLGSFCSKCNICATAFSHTNQSSLTWRRHNKNSQEKDGEKLSGADFTLILRLRNNFAKAAIFQAKNSKSDVGSFDAGHISPPIDEGDAELQFLRLKEYSMTTLSKTGIGQAKSIDELHWVHYLIYHDYSAYCCALSTMVDLDDKAKLGHPLGTIRFKERANVSFIDLLADGASISTDDGWLILDSVEKIKLFVSKSRDIFNVYEARAEADCQWEPVASDDSLPILRSQAVAMVRSALVPAESQERDTENSSNDDNGSAQPPPPEESNGVGAGQPTRKLRL